MAEEPVVQKKPLSEERLQQLEQARKRALEVRRQNIKSKQISKAKELIAQEEANPLLERPPTPPKEEQHHAFPSPEPVRPPPRSKRRNIVVVEQDSDESEYEDSERVIFVKRKKKPSPKKEPPPAMNINPMGVNPMYRFRRF